MQKEYWEDGEDKNKTIAFQDGRTREIICEDCYKTNPRGIRPLRVYDFQNGDKWSKARGEKILPVYCDQCGELIWTPPPMDEIEPSKIPDIRITQKDEKIFFESFLESDPVEIDFDDQIVYPRALLKVWAERQAYVEKYREEFPLGKFGLKFELTVDL